MFDRIKQLLKSFRKGIKISMKKFQDDGRCQKPEILHDVQVENATALNLQNLRNDYRIKEKIKANQKRSPIRENENSSLADVTNPYLQSKSLWNDMYGDVQTKLENAYRIIFILSLVIGVAIVGFILIAGEVKVKPIPFVIHGDEVVTLNATNVSDSQAIQTQLANYFVKQFIRDSRSVSVDSDVNQNQEIAAYSFVSGAATKTLTDFYEKYVPKEIASSHVKSVHITSVLRSSRQSFDIRWDEETRKVETGELVETKHFIAQITYQYQLPSGDAVVLRNNPMGFQITQLSWSEDIQS